MEKGKKIVVGMSGGVDSSVAAALLLEQGYDVIGITMKTYEFDDVGGNTANETSCCGLDAFNDARMVAVKLGIPHYVVDFTGEFGREVVDNFVGEYFRGRTPNPCIICNRTIKWGALLRKAELLGADTIATGHYARLVTNPSTGAKEIHRPVDSNKDQTYALWALSQDALSRTMFPLGGLRKPEVRAIASRLGLRTAGKEESFEICFVADNNYRRFLEERKPERSASLDGGELVLDGHVVGTHRGFPHYTIGQRSGLGAYGERVYVTSIDPVTNRVTLGRNGDLMKTSLIATGLNLIGVERGAFPSRVEAQVRYKDEPAPATVTLRGDEVRLVFDRPKRAVTPGQSLVMYSGPRLLGGAVIDRVLDEPIQGSGSSTTDSDRP